MVVVLVVVVVVLVVLIALDLENGLSTPAGEFMASVTASAAQRERRLVGQRTREALAVKRAQSVRLGRPPVLPQELVDRIVADRRRARLWPKSHVP